MKRRGCLSESQLLDEQNSPSVCSEVAFMVTSIPKKPQHLSMLGAECVGGGVDVYRYSPSFLLRFRSPYLDHRHKPSKELSAHKYRP